ncbi:hypothetical protein JMUB6875_62280 [Nocardia sp. JMUB6875]
MGRRFALDLTVHRIPAAETEWLRIVGIDASGAVLVRPDQMIAWRTATLPGNPAEVLTDVLERVLARR